MPSQLRQELPEELRAKVLQLVAQQPAPSRRDVRRRALAWSVLGVALPVGLFAALGGVEQGPRPPLLLCATAIGIAGLSLLALGAALGRAGRTLGPPRVRLLLVALLPPLLLTSWKLGCSAAVPSALNTWATRPGLRCFGVSLLFGLAPLVAFLIARRGSDPVHPRSLGAALGAAGGLWAATWVDLWCPVANPLHVVLGHALPLLALAALGAWAGARILATAASAQSRR